MPPIVRRAPTLRLPLLLAAALLLAVLNPGRALAGEHTRGGSGPGAPASCSFADMRACDGCAALAEAIKGVAPHEGRYEDDIKWSPLFGAFLKNCQSLGRKLLDDGADPNLGGRQGSMLISVSTRWDRRDLRSSRQWARLLKAHGADADAVLPDTGRSSRQLVDAGAIRIDYPEIWSSFD